MHSSSRNEIKCQLIFYGPNFSKSVGRGTQYELCFANEAIWKAPVTFLSCVRKIHSQVTYLIKTDFIHFLFAFLASLVYNENSLIHWFGSYFTLRCTVCEKSNNCSEMKVFALSPMKILQISARISLAFRWHLIPYLLRVSYIFPFHNIRVTQTRKNLPRTRFSSYSLSTTP